MDKKIKINVIYNAIYQLLSIAIPLVTMPYVARVLGAENIGKYSYAYSISYYFMIFAMLGLQNYGNRKIAQVRDNKYNISKNFSEIYIMQIITSICAVFCFIMYAILKKNIFIWVMLPYVISSIFDVSWFFFGIEEFKITLIRNMIIKVISTVLIFIFIKSNKYGTILYCSIISVGNLISQLILWIKRKKYVKFTKVSIRDVLMHFKPNLVLFIPIIASSLYKIMDKIMIGNMSQMSQLGFYENIEKIINVPITLICSIGTVLMPRISNLLSNNQKKEGYLFLEKSIYISLFVAIPICIGMISVANIFVPLFFGQGYDECINILYVLSISVIFTILSSMVRTQYLIPNNNDKKYIKSIIYGAVFNIIFNFYTIKKYGAVGAAMGTLLAEFIVCTYQILSIIGEINIIVYLKKCIGIFISAFIMFGTLWLIRFNVFNLFTQLILKILIGVIVYFLCIFAFYKNIIINYVNEYFK